MNKQLRFYFKQILLIIQYLQSQQITGDNSGTAGLDLLDLNTSQHKAALATPTFVGL